MHKIWLETMETYDGSQLKPLSNYLKHGLLGDSLVCWAGPCNVSPEHMIDGEDLRSESTIASDSMLHLIIELFHQGIHAGVFLQRIMGELTIRTINESGNKDLAAKLTRRGDDLYLDNKKLNVSIATSTSNSVLIHYGINIGNEGTPVETCALSDFGIENAQAFARSLADKISQEIESQIRATMKVKTF